MHSPLRANARILAAAMVGTAVEYYDFFIYATAAALVFGRLFFPVESPAAQTLLAFVSFGVAFVARPIGAIAFGHFGDRVGRKSTLVASLLLMGASTVAIAFLPTYAVAGWVAPALLCLLRFGQGLGLGGEWGGAALLAIENAPGKWRARFGVAPQLGVPVGFCAATGMFLLLDSALTDAEFMAWGWRIPFLASALLVFIGLWVRLKIGETPAFREALEREAPLKLPFAKLLGDHLGAVVAGSAGVVSTFALFYLGTAFALAQTTGPGGFARQTILIVQLVANLFFLLGLILAAMHTDRTSAGRTIAGGALATAAIGLVFSPVLASGSLPIIAAGLCTAMFALGFTSGPLGPWLSELFPVRVRYSGISLAFNAGGIIGGALTPIAAQALTTSGAMPYTGLLLTFAGGVTWLGIRLSR